MTCRFRTTWLTRLALAFLMILVCHDVAMAMDPHTVGVEVSEGDHQAPGHHASHAHEPTVAVASDAEAVACMSFEAACASEPIRTDGEQGCAVLAESRWAVAVSEARAIDHDEPGITPGQRRAMLQVYLN